MENNRVISINANNKSAFAVGPFDTIEPHIQKGFFIFSQTSKIYRKNNTLAKFG
jgi:hypothetical protein